MTTTVPFAALRLLDLAPPMVHDMDDIEGNGKNAATLALLAQLTTQIGRIESQNTAIQNTLHTHSVEMATIREGLKTFATKLELQPVANEARAAHQRIDALSGSLTVLGSKIQAVEDATERIERAMETREAESRGTWKVIKPSLGWILGVLATVVAAYFVGAH